MSNNIPETAISMGMMAPILVAYGFIERCKARPFWFHEEGSQSQHFGSRALAGFGWSSDYSLASGSAATAFFAARFLAVFCAAHRAFCAAAILALPSALITRFADFLAGAAGLFTDPFGRPRRLATDSTSDIASELPTSMARTCCSFAISTLIASKISFNGISPHGSGYFVRCLARHQIMIDRRCPASRTLIAHSLDRKVMAEPAADGCRYALSLSGWMTLRCLLESVVRRCSGCRSTHHSLEFGNAINDDDRFE